MTAATRATTIPPVDALDPIATPAPGDCPIWDAVVRDLGCPFPQRRDARGRFVARGQR